MDFDFIKILNEIRYGLCTEKCTMMFSQCNISIKAVPNDGIMPTMLYYKNSFVDIENENELDKLPGDTISYTSIDKHIPFVDG